MSADPKNSQAREDETSDRDEAKAARVEDGDPEERQQSKRDDDEDEVDEDEVDEDDIADELDFDDLAAMEGPDA